MGSDMFDHAAAMRTELEYADKAAKAINDVEKLRQRIAKARQILMPLSDKDSRPYVVAMVHRALEALDGK